MIEFSVPFVMNTSSEPQPVQEKRKSGNLGDNRLGLVADTQISEV